MRINHILRYALALLLTGFLMASCQQKPQQQQKVDDRQVKESLEKANRYLISDEEEDINNYVRRHQWEMSATGTGLRYQVIKEGTGPRVQPGQKVTLDYVLYDIMGDVVYSSDNKGSMSFVVGGGDVVSGLDEVVRLLRQGDEARAIIPSHLGYGLLGDQDLIPSRATLIYYLKVKKIE